MNRRIFNVVKGQPRFNVRNEAETTQMFLYDEISDWGVTSRDFVQSLMSLNGQDFELHVNSPGGDVFEGLAILNNLRSYPGRITAIVDGLAASAASFILMGADDVKMAPNSELMIHDAWGLTIGNADDMTQAAVELNRVSENIASIYATAAQGSDGPDRAAWRALMKSETWFGAEEAVLAGLASGLTTASGTNDLAFDTSRFRNSKPTKQASTAQSQAHALPDFALIFKSAFERKN